MRHTVCTVSRNNAANGLTSNQSLRSEFTFFLLVDVYESRLRCIVLVLEESGLVTYMYGCMYVCMYVCMY
jgi:hypothetical protein